MYKYISICSLKNILAAFKTQPLIPVHLETICLLHFLQQSKRISYKITGLGQFFAYAKTQNVNLHG